MAAADAIAGGVTATAAALELIREIRQRHGDDLIFHQSGGCCDGSSPMCLPRSDFPLGSVDHQLGEIGGVPFYMSAEQFERWSHTQLIIDVVPGIGGMFSLDNGTGRRFLTRSEVCDAGETGAA
ncbi:MAG: DUF779 domain-containing protein [Pseudomonadota bacterium]